MAHSQSTDSQPLADLEHWDEFLQLRYPDEQVVAAATSGFTPHKDEAQFRDYRAAARPAVKEFYRLNHTYQTYAYVQQQKRVYLRLDKRRMGIWEAMEYLNTLVDDSDPDTDLSQIEHLLQAAEAIRQDGHPDWFILTGLIHDLGKILCLWGEPQWGVVGDTFPVGCAYSDNIVFPEFFAANPDQAVPQYQTPCGIYAAGCGFEQVHLSWGHDEYLYHVVRDYLPPAALYMIRYHSFYAAHKEGAYDYLMNDADRAGFAWVRRFNPYDLYSKSATRPDVAALRPFYEALIAKYFPPVLRW